MSRPLRVALTETKNAYAPMPPTVERLGELRGKLDELRDANIAHHLELLASAAEAGAQLVGFGELFAAPYFALGRDPLWIELAEDALDGPTVRALRPAARAHGMILVAPIYELCAETGQRFNTAVVIDERGEVIGKYRKTHIPRGENEAGSFDERFYYEPSNGELGDWPANVSKNPYFPVFETKYARVGVAICYDRHFDGVLRTLAHQGAVLVLCPAVTFGQKSRRLWEQEFPVDAARHHLFVGGSNRAGAEPPWDQEYFGGSYFCGPNGVLPADRSRPGLVIADLDLDALSEPDSSGWSLHKDARPKIYD